MELFKTCTVCKTKNNISDMLCSFCMSDISSIMPESERDNIDNDITIIENSTLTLIFPNKTELKIKSGDTIGRLDNPLLQEYKTISRKHALFSFYNGKWFVKDLNSSNGTKIDGIKIDSDKDYEIKKNQILSFSSSFQVVVDYT